MFWTKANAKNAAQETSTGVKVCGEYTHTQTNQAEPKIAPLQRIEI